AVTFGGTPATSFTVDSATQITAVAPAGTGTVQVTVTTAGGTTNGVGYTYVAVPALTTVLPNVGLEAGGTTVVVTGTGLSTASAVTFGGTPATSFTVDSDTQITAVAPAGTGTVQLTVTTAGGVSNGVAYTYVAVPALTTVVPNVGPASGGTTVIVTGTGLTGASAVTFGATPATSFTVDSATQITAVAPADGDGAAHGDHIRRNQQRPRLHLYSGAQPGHGASECGLGSGRDNGRRHRDRVDRSIRGHFRGHSGDFVHCGLGHPDHGRSPRGTGTVQLTVTTSGGTSNGLAYTYIPAPSLATVLPNVGLEAGGAIVVLTGTALSTTSAVTFGGTPATSFTVDSATQITAVAPAGTGTVQVTVTSAGGTSNGVAYTYVGIPSLTAVLPNTGPEIGGTTVVLAGINLTGATAVNFGPTPAASFTVDSALQITAVAPAGTGTVQVSTTTAGGTTNGVAYTYV
ncbi:IPT/TIG domain-containing protein, partial [Nocardia fusca]|uniref:IPT/TIG domain-containing protein n=1 Tax=Nocardia fusca TaxID=941183 RepID=UPI000AAAC56E